MKNVKDKPAILAPYLNGYTTATKLVFDNIIDDLNLKQDDKAYISSEIDKILKFLKYDKKNAYGHIYFVLLKDIATPIWNIEVEESVIYEAFDYYLE